MMGNDALSSVTNSLYNKYASYSSDKTKKKPPNNKNNNQHRKKKKKNVQKKRSNEKLIEFYQKNRRFITLPSDDQKSDMNEQKTIVRVMSYNILADGHRYALSHQHSYCSIKYRRWSYRFQSILCQLRAYKPDIVCIQETTPSLWNNKMKYILNELGYDGIHAARAGNDQQSDCIIYKKEKYKLIKHKISRLAQCVKNNKEYDTLFGSDKSIFRNMLHSCPDVVIVCSFECKQTNKQFLVCSSHFFWDPKSPEIKSAQCLIFNLELQHLLKSEWDMDFAQIPIIFGVDANSLPFKAKKDEFDPFLPLDGSTSGVYELMTNGILKKEHKDHPLRRINEREKEYQKTNKSAISRREVEYVKDLDGWKVDIEWKSVYSVVNKRNKCKEPLFTNRVQIFTGCLDYLFLSGACAPISFLEMPYQNNLSYHMLKEMDNEQIQKEIDEEIKASKSFALIPNVHHPSDHIPLCADIQIL